MHRVEVAASILTADFGNLYRVVRKLEKSGVDRMHLDVMDGHFVDNITFGPEVVAAVRRLTALPIDAHLMISEPAHFWTGSSTPAPTRSRSMSKSRQARTRSARPCNGSPPHAVVPAWP